MSEEKHAADAMRWLAQARADLRAAQASLLAASHEWACFQAQQAAEKALKAVWLARGLDPWGHSVLRLIDGFPDEALREDPLGSMRVAAKTLDKLYIPTRYPNGLPDLAPFEVYGGEDAEVAIESARGILTVCESLCQTA